MDGCSSIVQTGIADNSIHIEVYVVYSDPSLVFWDSIVLLNQFASGFHVVHGI